MRVRAALWWMLLLSRGSGLAQLPAEPTAVRVAVLSLFHPRLLEISQGTRLLEVRWAAADRLEVTGSGGRREVVRLRLPEGEFTLHVTGQRTDLRRTYRGILTVTAGAGELHPVVTMGTELAVASVVAAESLPGAAPAALEAQAIAARSFLLSNLHPGLLADTCDTTRCQLLREPPPPGSMAGRAARATSHQVLVWRPEEWVGPRLVAARWTPSCAGHTLAGHPRDSSGYPFYSVSCRACQQRPDRWRLPPGAPAPATEADRERWNRSHPEAQVPSLGLTGDGTIGQGRGHGLGLCQRGAAALAVAGQSSRAILMHYFPNTSIATLP